jgi:hypothetical protein
LPVATARRTVRHAARLPVAASLRVAKLIQWFIFLTTGTSSAPFVSCYALKSHDLNLQHRLGLRLGSLAAQSAFGPFLLAQL